MNKKIKILGLSVFIATGMVSIGSTQIFADEINPTQVEERKLDIDENYYTDDNQEGQNNHEDIDENEDLNFNEEQDVDDDEIIPINDYVEDYDIDDNNTDEWELIGQPKGNDIPKTSDAGIRVYIGAIIASIGGLFAVIRKMM